MPCDTWESLKTLGSQIFPFSLLRQDLPCYFCHASWPTTPESPAQCQGDKSHHIQFVCLVFLCFVFCFFKDLFCFQLCVSMCRDCMYVRKGACGGQMRASDPLKLEFLAVMSHHVGTKNQIWGLQKNSQCLNCREITRSTSSPSQSRTEA